MWHRRTPFSHDPLPLNSDLYQRVSGLVLSRCRSSPEHLALDLTGFFPWSFFSLVSPAFLPLWTLFACNLVLCFSCKCRYSQLGVSSASLSHSYATSSPPPAYCNSFQVWTPAEHTSSGFWGHLFSAGLLNISSLSHGHLKISVSRTNSNCPPILSLCFLFSLIFFECLGLRPCSLLISPSCTLHIFISVSVVMIS